MTALVKAPAGTLASGIGYRTQDRSRAPAQASERRVSTLLLLTLAGLWAIPVAMFVVAPTYEPPAWPVWFATAATQLLCLADPRIATLAIPFAAMLAPLAQSGRLAGLLPSEVLLGFNCIALLVLRARHGARLRLLPGDRLLLGMAAVAALSYLLSFAYEDLGHAFVNWLALVAVFAMTRAQIRSLPSVRSYLTALGIASAYVCAIVISSFVHAMPLAVFMAADEQQTTELTIEGLFRASYFYTNVLYLLGPAAAIALSGALTGRTALVKLAAAVLFATILTTVALMMAKTAVVAVFACVAALLLIQRSLLVANRQFRRARWYSFGFFLMICLAGAIATSLDRLSDYGVETTSLFARFEVFWSALATALQEPARMLVGFGPDASTRLHGALMEQARSGSDGTEGAIDSAYLTFLIDYGVVFVGLFTAYGVRTFTRLLRVLRQDPGAQGVLATLCAVFAFIFVAALTQTLGTSKVAWLVAQLFAITGICLVPRARAQPGTTPRQGAAVVLER